MSTTSPDTTVEKTPEQVEAEAKAAQLAAEAREAHVAEVVEYFSPIMQNRVRIAFDDRKMSVPGRLFSSPEIPVGLATNWGLELDLTKEQYTGVELKDLDSGRFTKYAPVTTSETDSEPQDEPEPEPTAESDEDAIEDEQDLASQDA